MICWNWCTCKTLATWPRKPGHLAGFFYYFPALRFAPIAKPPAYRNRARPGPAWPGRLCTPLGRFLAPSLAVNLARGPRPVPRRNWPVVLKTRSVVLELRAPAGARKKPRPGAGLRGPRCTGRAWWPVDLVTWAAPAGPVAVVPGAQLIAPRLVHAFAVNRSQVSACVRS